jgi:hypothetical protein
VGSLVLDRLTLVFFTASIILAVVGMLAIRYFVLLAERYSTNDMGTSSFSPSPARPRRWWGGCLHCE